MPLLAFGLGALGATGFEPDNRFALVWVSVGGLFLLVRGRRPGPAAFMGFFWGLGLFVVGVSWVYISLHDFGGMPVLLAALATFAFCAYLSLYPALAAALTAGLGERTSFMTIAAFAGIWTLSEWARGTLLTGFPWLAIGYSQAPPSPLAGYAPIAGVYGVSLVTAALAACIAEWARRWFGQTESCVTGWARWLGVCSAVPMIAGGAMLAVGAGLATVPWTRPVGAPVRVALLQGNVAQDLKWRPERFVDSMLAYYRLARDHPASLIVLPETALPSFFDRLPLEYRQDLEAIALGNRGNILLGSVVGEPARYTNSVISLGLGPQQRYDKVHLVPFGEFIPPGFRGLLSSLDIPMSEFSRGASNQKLLELVGQKLAINICYEDVFGEELIRSLPAATLLVNVSNTAWFGRSRAQAQHLQIARMRALETGRPMLRATNTGMTAVVDPDGRVTSVLEPFTRGALVAEVRGHSGETPYVRYGNGVALLVALALAVAAYAGGRPRGGAQRPESKADKIAPSQANRRSQ